MNRNRDEREARIVAALKQAGYVVCADECWPRLIRPAPAQPNRPLTEQQRAVLIAQLSDEQLQTLEQVIALFSGDDAPVQ